jgi:hypothetical protein
MTDAAVLPVGAASSRGLSVPLLLAVPLTPAPCFCDLSNHSTHFAANYLNPIGFPVFHFERVRLTRSVGRGLARNA